ncbi:hydrolase [Tremella mesenterica]|uniref:Hydrolase n=1 Tax=Tremella mesenterica TaxID=5217 RepID=A0A4Q1BCY6_TREME|nr:hydrolase [Tremella mesenterica]
MAVELEEGSIPADALEALRVDASLPICLACGTQYPVARTDCPICEDPRQFVPPSGQAWTTLADLSSNRKHTLLPDKEDKRVTFIQTIPGFGIDQTPTLIETGSGSYIWDCAALLTPHLISYLKSLKTPLRAIAISHPHFFSTSLTWARALQVPLYICEDDKPWFQRLSDVSEGEIKWWRGKQELGPGVTVIQCGGHFEGSAILHWDRLSEPAPPVDDLPTSPTPVSGLILTADTIMVQRTQKRFTFLWSAPNMIPLNPTDVVGIWNRVKTFPFSQATSSWPGRFIRSDAKSVLEESVREYLKAMGWEWDGENSFVPL